MRDIILASGSPRRFELLTKMGLQFVVVPSDFDEYLDDSRTTEDIAKELGLGKALAVAATFPEALVVGSDTIVTLQGRQLGKPRDITEAREFLKAHSGQTVTVTSSIALVCKTLGLKQVSADTATVVFKPYDPRAAEKYLATGDWHDKAGGWAIQSGAAPLIDHIAGEYDTILGLPTKLLVKYLAKQGIKAEPVMLVPPVPQVNVK